MKQSLLTKVQINQLSKYANQYRKADNNFEQKYIERRALTYIYGHVEEDKRLEMMRRYKKLRDMK